MKQFSSKYLTVQSFVACVVLINGILGVPLNHIISDAIKEKSGIISSSPTTAAEFNIHLQGDEHHGLHTKENPHKVNTPSTGFPSRADDDENTRTNQELSAGRRTRRSAHDSSEYCTVSSNTQAGDLETYLNVTNLSPEMPVIPADQPDTCPNFTRSGSNGWWPGTEENLRTLCPWIWIRKDLETTFGSTDVYPRFVKEASCLCMECMENNAYSCINLYKEVTVLQKTGCKNGLAVLVKKTVNVVAGCACQKPTTITPTNDTPNITINS